MRIKPNAEVQLEEGDEFLNERIIEDGLRLITLKTSLGAFVTVTRHFAWIGPIIIRPDGRKIHTEVNRETGMVEEWKDAPAYLDKHYQKGE